MVGPNGHADALEGVDAVVHLASFGMSGREMLARKMIYDVNVGGTENLLGGLQRAHRLRHGGNSGGGDPGGTQSPRRRKGTSREGRDGQARPVPFVYVSTYNVVFDGRSEIVNGNEANVPYARIDGQVDDYSRTKTIAEQIALAADATALPDGTVLRTCAVRPGAVPLWPLDQHWLRGLPVLTYLFFFFFFSFSV